MEPGIGIATESLEYVFSIDPLRVQLAVDDCIPTQCRGNRSAYDCAHSVGLNSMLRVRVAPGVEEQAAAPFVLAGFNGETFRVTMRENARHILRKLAH